VKPNPAAKTLTVVKKHAAAPVKKVASLPKTQAVPAKTVTVKKVAATHQLHQAKPLAKTAVKQVPH